jgi:hypothetical protein
MKKSFIALITIIFCGSMFFACDEADIFDKIDSSKYSGGADNKDLNNQDNDDEFLSGISYTSIYYDNTLSITPLSERERVSIDLHTNDIEEARNWSVLSQKNGSANRTLINERENEKYFEFLWVEEWNNIRYGLLSRVHRSEYFIPLFDTFKFFPRFDDFNENYTVGIYNGDQSIDNVKKFVEYLWVQPLSMIDEIIELNITEEENIIKIFILSQNHTRTGYNNKFVYDMETRVLTFAERRAIEEVKFAKVVFFEEYGLTLEFVGIWNDYMPGGGWKLTPEGDCASICTVHISSPAGLPSMEISVNIITDSIRFDNIPFYELYGNEQFGMIYPGKYWKDYRPAIGIRVGDYDRYTMEIIVKIDRKQQVITVGDKVGVTH